MGSEEGGWFRDNALGIIVQLQLQVGDLSLSLFAPLDISFRQGIPVFHMSDSRQKPSTDSTAKRIKVKEIRKDESTAVLVFYFFPTHFIISFRPTDTNLKDKKLLRWTFILLNTICLS